MQAGGRLCFEVVGFSGSKGECGLGADSSGWLSEGGHCPG